jgi:hypothetical protein
VSRHAWDVSGHASAQGLVRGDCHLLRHPHRWRGFSLHRSRSLSPMPITHSESGTATHPGAIGRASVEAEGPDGWQSPATPTHPDAVGRASVEAEGPDGWQSPGAPPACYAVCSSTAIRLVRHFIEGTAEGHDPLSALVFLKSSFPHSFTIRHSCSRSGSRYTAMAIAKRCADLFSARAGLRDLSLARIPASQGALIKAAIVRGPEPVGFYHIIKLSRMHVLSRIRATRRRIRDASSGDTIPTTQKSRIRRTLVAPSP